MSLNHPSKNRSELVGKLVTLRQEVAELEQLLAKKDGVWESPLSFAHGVWAEQSPTENLPGGGTAGRNAQADVILKPVEQKSGLQAKIPLLCEILAEAPIIVWAVDRAGTVILSEGKKLEALGVEPGEMVGQSIFELYGDVPNVKRDILRAMKGESFGGAAELNGAVLSSWHTPLREASGRIVGVAGIAIDVTKQTQAEEVMLAERHLMESMLRSHERDRRLIAYEIHDGLVQDITGAQMQLEGMLHDDRVPQGPVRDQLQLALGLAQKAVRESRRFISGLRPPILDELGIVAAIKYLVGPNIDLEIDVQFERLEPLLEATIYRIAQEAVTNIGRHSKSDRARIRLTQLDNRLQMEIRDWGAGFSLADVEEGRLGLQGIRERAQLLRGWAVIDSAPGKGTRVFVDLPLVECPKDKETVIANDRSIE